MITIRIDLDGQERTPFRCNHAWCCPMIISDVTIDRSLPGALSSRMSASGWTQFCDKIDEALTFIGESKRKVLECPIISIVPIIGWYTEWKRHQLIRAQLQEAKNDVKVLCRAESDKIPGVSFRLREEEHIIPFQIVDSYNPDYSTYVTLYIECSISDSPSTMERGSLVATLPVAMVVSEVFDNNNKSASERLAELEDIKGMLTEKEYNSKRTAILASV